MYIKRQPLGRGNLSFGPRKPRFPILAILAYLAILLGALFVWWRQDALRPRVMAALGPTPTPTPTILTLTEQGEQAYFAGDMETAVALYRQAASIDPQNTAISARLGHMLCLLYAIEATDTALLDEAQALADNIILIAPEEPTGYALKAQVLNWRGEPGEAAFEALLAIEKDAQFVDAHAQLSEAYTDLGRLRQALEQAELAVSLDPYNVEARAAYAYVLENYGGYNSAIVQYQQALNIEPARLDLLYGLARNLRATGRTDEAVQTFISISLMIPGDPLPYTELGRTYFEMRDDAAAQEYLEQAVELVCSDCPRNTGIWEESWQGPLTNLPDQVYIPAWRRLGMVYFTRRNYEDAIDIMEEALAWGEQQEAEVPIETYYVTASAYYYLDQCSRAVPRAVEAFNIYLEREMNDPNALRNILSVFVLCRDYAGTPYVHTGPGFVNGFPAGYAEPDVTIERPGGGGGSDEDQAEEDAGEGEDSDQMDEDEGGPASPGASGDVQG